LFLVAASGLEEPMDRTGRTLGFALAALAALAPGLSRLAVAQQVLVENDQLAPNEVLTTRTIYAFRNLPNDAIKQTNGDGVWVLSKDAIIGSALDSPILEKSQKRTLRQALNEKGDAGDTTLEAMKLALAAQRREQTGFAGAQLGSGLMDPDNSNIAAYDGSGYHVSAHGNDVYFLTMDEKPKIVSYPTGTQGSSFIDTVALGSIVDAGSLAVWSGGSRPAAPTITTAGLVLDPHFAMDVKSIYATIDKVAWNASPAANAQALSAAKKISFSDPKLAATTLSAIGKVEYGNPIAYTIDDKKLVVEPSLRKRFDVYWIDFAFSPSEEVINSSSEMNFSVALSDRDSMALQLAPRELDRTATDASAATARPQGAMTVMVQTATGATTVEHLYNQTIEYHYLRPTIHSKGLQETTFGWDLTDEMLTPSAKRFVAIVAVPKAATEVKCTLTVSIRIRQSFWSKVDEAVDDPVPCDIKLPR
jgi:hypothetical protein